MAAHDPIAGLLLDIDGVLYVGEEVVPGARETVAELKERGIPCRFITNTTTKPAAAVCEKLRRLGFEVADEEVFSAVTATRDFLRGKGARSVHLLVCEEILEEFVEFEQGARSPEYVVVGDIGAAWSYELLNQVFNELMNGAQLVAMHRNKYWQTQEGLRMDIGAFVAGLEYVTGLSATIIGKPARAFFELGVKSLGLRKSQVAVVGDDIESDVGGAQAAGLRGVLVRTGKYREEAVARSGVDPDVVIGSVADVIGMI